MKKPGSGKAVNNHAKWFEYKVTLRIKSIEHLNFVRVLECFAGEGKLWDEVERRTGKKIYRFRIDTNFYPKVDIVGRAENILKVISLDRYHVIDLDSWGSPSRCLGILFEKEYSGIVHCTYCSPIPFSPDMTIASEYFDIDKQIIKKSPSLFAKDVGTMITSFIKARGIDELYGHIDKERNYFYFITN